MRNYFNLHIGSKTIIVMAILAMTLVACKSKNEPQQYTGSIIGTIGCYDAKTQETFYQGYYIETNTKDTFLTFYQDVIDYEVPYGSYTMPAVPIPYSFLVTVLKEDDERYVHYAPIIQDAMHQPIWVKDEKQVIISPTD